MKKLLTIFLTTALCGVIDSALTQKAGAANLVQNGSFETVTGGVGGQLDYNGFAATDWATTGYNFLMQSGSADTTGEPGIDGFVAFWGPNDGAANGLPATSPDGGNFVALDSYLAPGGGIAVAALTQTINGLTPGQTYALSFYWAGAQEYNYGGATTDQLLVSLGTQTDDTAIVSLASHGFSGWAQTTLDYTASSTSEVLSFLATGTPPVSDPPFVFLDGVSLTTTSSVPDTASTAMLFGCAATVLGFAARRYNRQ
jgi:hypothetical protein